MLDLFQKDQHDALEYARVNMAQSLPYHLLTYDQAWWLRWAVLAAAVAACVGLGWLFRRKIAAKVGRLMKELTTPPSLR